MVGFLAKVAIGFGATAAAYSVSALLQKLVDRATGKDAGAQEPQSQLRGAPDLNHLTSDEEAAYTIGTIALLAKMTVADGASTFDEVRAFRQVFHVTGENLDDIATVFNSARQSDEGYEDYADPLARIFAGQPEVLEAIIDAMMTIAGADHVVTSAEEEFVNNVARRLGLEADIIDRLIEQHKARLQRDPYLVIGVRRVQTTAEIENAYKKQMAEYSPEKLHEHGMPNAFGELAALRMAVLTEAMEAILKERDETGLSDGEPPGAYFEQLLDLRPLGFAYKGFGVGEDPRYASEEEREAWRARNAKY